MMASVSKRVAVMTPSRNLGTSRTQPPTTKLQVLKVECQELSCVALLVQVTGGITGESGYG